MNEADRRRADIAERDARVKMTDDLRSVATKLRHAREVRGKPEVPYELIREAENALENAAEAIESSLTVTDLAGT